MVYNATVLYPNEDDATFDMDYYLKTHMPLVMDTWGTHGLKKWEVIKFAAGPDGGKPQFSVQAILSFENADSVKNALASEETAKVFGDVKNFSNKGPVFLSGDVTGTS